MNTRRRVAVACSILGFAVSTVCLHHTTPLTMLAFFNGALPLFALGIVVYLYDLATIMLELRKGESR